MRLTLHGEIGSCTLRLIAARGLLVLTAALAATRVAADQVSEVAEPNGLAILDLAESFYSGEGGLVDQDKAGALFEEASQLGSPMAKFRVATLHYLGRAGFEQDHTAAQTIAREHVGQVAEAANGGNPLAQYYLGSAYLFGLGVPADPREAMKWYEKAAVTQSGASHNLGWMFKTGTGTASNPEVASRWFEQAANAGHAASMFELSVFYMLGHGVEQDLEAGAEWLAAAAERRLPIAMERFGYYSIQGRYGVARDAARGVSWLVEALLEGDTTAIHSIIGFRANDELSDADVVPVHERLEEESAAGNIHATAALSLLVTDGWLGVRPNRERAFKLALAAAQQGSAVGKYAVGWSYWKGLGAPRDLEMAIKWFRESAEQGYYMAQYRMGIQSLRGEGVQKDLDEGLRWLKLSAVPNYWAALMHLARLYEHGHYGVRADREEARYWYERAAKIGNAEAIGWLKAEAALEGDGN